MTIPYASELSADAPPSSSPLPATVTQAATPPGFVSFCVREPDQCPLPGSVHTAELTAGNWRLIENINREVNAAIWPEDDEKHYGRAEYWTIPGDGYGDCEDYALMKRKALMQAGLPVGALRIAIVMTPRNGRHAVLTVTTDKGDYVLDNLRDNVLPWDQAGFAWIERQDPLRPLAWTLLDTAPRRLAAAGAIASAGQPVSAMPSAADH